MPVTVAFLDASVLYPAPLRDLLLELAVSDLFRAKWSQAVHEEWIRALLRRRPDLSAERLERTRRLMDAHVRDALVAGYEDLVPTVALPDPDDRHVVAAAVRGEAHIVLTANLSGVRPFTTRTGRAASRRFPCRPLRPVAGAVPGSAASRPRAAAQSARFPRGASRRPAPSRTERHRRTSPHPHGLAAHGRPD